MPKSSFKIRSGVISLFDLAFSDCDYNYGTYCTCTYTYMCVRTHVYDPTGHPEKDDKEPRKRQDQSHILHIRIACRYSKNVSRKWILHVKAIDESWYARQERRALGKRGASTCTCCSISPTIVVVDADKEYRYAGQQGFRTHIYRHTHRVMGS